MEAAVGGMEAIVTQLTTGVTDTLLFSTLGDIMPFVIKLIPFALALVFLRRVVKGSSKGKVRF
ncbi:MAG: hypothetical protein U0M66_04600 [Bacilli bacterium]|nr:hypothetical protein [Bacilli bacterium]